MHIFILPALSSLAQCIFFLIWLSAGVFIFSVGNPEPRAMYPFVTEIMWYDETKGVLLYYLFGLFWVNAFIVGCTQYIIGGSTCIWYFSYGDDSKGKHTVRKAIKWLLRYNWASIAFGSAVIAICQMIRVLFEYYRKQVERLNMNLKIVKALIWSTRWVLWLMEHVIKYMTKNAYIQVVLTSKAFFPSAWNAFALMIKHAHRYGFGNAIGTVFIFFGCLLITVGTSAVAYLAGDNFALYF
jgi:solute carrier family 44 (choline transporter-like protein), member 2/4/5